MRIWLFGSYTVAFERAMALIERYKIQLFQKADSETQDTDDPPISLWKRVFGRKK